MILNIIFLILSLIRKKHASHNYHYLASRTKLKNTQRNIQNDKDKIKLMTKKNSKQHQLEQQKRTKTK